MASGRMLRTQISLSPQVNDLSIKSALLFTWIIPHVDDYGRLHADPRRIKATVVPMRDDINIEDVKSSLFEIYDKKLITLYKIENEIYLEVPKFEKHQKGLSKRTASKIPSPDPSKINCFEGFDGISVNSREIHGNSSPIELNLTELNLTEEKGTESYCSEAKKILASEPAGNLSVLCSEIFISIPLVDGSEFFVSEKILAQFEECYPAVNVRQELRKIRGWNLSRPKKRKTKRGIMAHINSWLSKEQDKGTSVQQNIYPQKVNNVVHNQLVLEKILKEEDDKLFLESDGNFLEEKKYVGDR